MTDWNMVALRDAIFASGAFLSMSLQARAGYGPWQINLLVYTVTCVTLDLLWPGLMHTPGGPR